MPAKKRTSKRPASKSAASRSSSSRSVKKAAKRVATPSRGTTPSGGSRGSDGQIVIGDGERAHLLDIPWGDKSYASRRGVRWNDGLRSWVWTGKALPAPLKEFASKPFSWERWKEDALNPPGAPPAHIRMPSPPKAIKLHDHQAAAADLIAAARTASLPGFLLADDVGLGKTYSTVAGVMKLRPRTVLVLCPLAVVPHWRRSIVAMGGHTSTRWLVINYDRAKSLLTIPENAVDAKRTRTRNKRIVSGGKSLVNWDVIVFDEAHLLRNPIAQRSTACRRLAGEGSDQRAFSIWLSATAGQNPLHLSYVAPLLGAATGKPVKNLEEFEVWAALQGIKLKQGAYGGWEWVRNERDLKRMREILFDGYPPIGLRRRPTDIAGWPEQQRIAYPVELDVRGWALYNEAWTEFRKELKLTRRGIDPKSGLVAQLRFRQKASLIRAQGTVELIMDMLENDRQVLVSAQFLESVEAIREELEKRKVSVAVIHGAMTAGEKEDERVRFQQGKAEVVVFTPTEGISLHAGEEASDATDTDRVTIVHDVRYSALDMKQVEGRAHRDGQNAICYYVYADTTVEEDITFKTIQRLSDMSTMLGDDTGWTEEIERVILNYRNTKKVDDAE